MMKQSNNWKAAGKQTNPFRVPDGYFESLEDRLVSQIVGTHMASRTRVRKLTLVRWMSGVAAVLLVAFVGFQQLHLKPNNEQIRENMMSAVIEYYAHDLDEISFAILMAENEITDADPNPVDPDFIDFMGVDEMSIIEALMIER